MSNSYKAMLLPLLFWLLTASCRHIGSGCHEWDNAYEAAILSLEATPGDAVEKASAHALRVLRSAWLVLPAHTRIHSRLLDSSKRSTNSVRLEMAGLVDYEFVWALEENGRALVYAGKGEEPTRQELSKERWQRTIDRLRQLFTQGLSSDTEIVTHGMAYYVSICLEGKAQQFVALGQPPEDFWEGSGIPGMPVSALGEGQKRAISLILNLVNEGSQ